MNNQEELEVHELILIKKMLDSKVNNGYTIVEKIRNGRTNNKQKELSNALEELRLYKSARDKILTSIYNKVGGAGFIND